MSNRFFTEEINEGAARISGPDAQHIARVLRAREGQQLTLCDGRGSDYLAEIKSVDAKEILLAVLSAAPSTGEPNLRAEVFIGMAKGERMDYAVQKSVELGAAAIIPFFSENSVVKPKNPGEKAARYARIATEAAKQCGRGILPVVEKPLDFAGVLARATACEKALFCYEEGGAPLRGAMCTAHGVEKTIAIITGPEGGFSPREAEMAAAAGCTTIGLGPRILRCETAPAAVLAAVMTLTGNLE